MTKFFNRNGKINSNHFVFYSPELDDSDHQCYYSPSSITSWWKSTKTTLETPENLGLFLHDIAHVVDFYRTNPSRLLQNDFGMKILNDSIPRSGMFVEGRVIGMQSKLASTSEMFHINDIESFYFSLIRNNEAYDQMAIDEFEGIVEESMNNNSIKSIIEDWNKACKWIKNNESI